MSSSLLLPGIVFTVLTISKKWNIKNSNTELMRSLVFILVSISLGLLSISCSSPRVTLFGQSAGLFALCNGAEPQGLDPHVVRVPNHIVRAIFEGLAVKNPITLEAEPEVAEKWEISEDGRIYTFYINPSAKWSNGERMTASDYVWSWNEPPPRNGIALLLHALSIVNAEAMRRSLISPRWA